MVPRVSEKGRPRVCGKFQAETHIPLGSSSSSSSRSSSRRMTFMKYESLLLA
jgi:hypothetical protein